MSDVQNYRGELLAYARKHLVEDSAKSAVETAIADLRSYKGRVLNVRSYLYHHAAQAIDKLRRAATA